MYKLDPLDRERCLFPQTNVVLPVEPGPEPGLHRAVDSRPPRPPGGWDQPVPGPELRLLLADKGTGPPMDFHRGPPQVCYTLAPAVVLHTPAHPDMEHCNKRKEM